MSLTGCKDIDIYILQLLCDKDLRNICQTNKYYFNLYNNDVLWRNKIFKIVKNYNYIIRADVTQYNNLLEAENDSVIGLFHAINMRDYCTLYHIVNNLKININYYFVVNNILENGQVNTKNTYYSKRNVSDTIWRYSPIDSILSTGDIQMWNILKLSIYKLEINSYNFSIIGNNLQIIKELVSDYKIEINSSVLIHTIRRDKIDILQLFLNSIDITIIEETVNTIFNETIYGINDWIEKSNSTFKWFIKIPIVNSFIENKLLSYPYIYQKRWKLSLF